jgi:hypothetical protein
MLKCSVRSCHEMPIAGFEELVENSVFVCPHLAIPLETRYWCLHHLALGLEARGKFSHMIDLKETGRPDDLRRLDS